MTVEADTSSAQYSTNGTTGPFAVPFYFLAASHLLVVYTSAAGVATTLTLTTDYSVSGAGDAAGGSITTVTAYASGGTIAIVRDVPLTQFTDYVAGDAFPADAHERALDKLTMIVQQLAEVLGRSVRVGVGDTTDTELPSAASRANLLQGYDSSGRFALVAPVSGSATDLAISLASSNDAAKGAAQVANSAYTCSTRALLKSLPTSIIQAAHLTEAGRGGLFFWRTGDYAALVAADTQEGVYLKAAAVSASVGAWVRLTPGDGEWHLDWFGVPNDPAAGNGGGSEVQAHTQLTALINLANIVKPSKLVFGSKIYTLGAAIPAIAWQIIIEGSRGYQGTIIVKRYVEASATRGMLAFSDWGFDARDMTLRGGSGSGGAGVSAILTLNQPASGRSYLRGVYVSLGSTANYSLYVNGASNTTVSGPSYRGLFIEGGEYFGASVAAVSLNSVNHVLGGGVFLTNSGGSSNIALEINGNVNAYSDDVQLTGIIGGRVTLDWLARSTFTGPMADNWTIGANVTSTMRVGHRVSGAILTNGAAAGEFIDSYDAGVVASGGNSSAGWRKWGSGKIQQWGTATTVSGVVTGQSFPVAFTSTNVNISGSKATDSGANIVNIAQFFPTSVSAYSVKSADFNFSSGAYSGAGAVLRWFADGT